MGTTQTVFLNFLKMQVEKFARWLIDRGYRSPIGQELLSGIDGIFGAHTGIGLEMIAALINVPEPAKMWLKKKLGAAVGDKISDIADEFIDELFERLRDIWAAHGQNLPAAELDKLGKQRAAQPILVFASALLELNSSTREGLIEILTSFTPSEKPRFVSYRSRLNTPKALVSLYEAGRYAPSNAQRANAALLAEIQEQARVLMFQHLTIVYGEYAENAGLTHAKQVVRRAGEVIADAAEVVYGDPAVEIPRLTQTLEAHTQSLATRRAAIRTRRKARR